MERSQYKIRTVLVIPLGMKMELFYLSLDVFWFKPCRSLMDTVN